MKHYFNNITVYSLDTIILKAEKSALLSEPQKVEWARLWDSDKRFKK